MRLDQQRHVYREGCERLLALRCERCGGTALEHDPDELEPCAGRFVVSCVDLALIASAAVVEDQVRDAASQS